jgi:hypothetical protein
VLWGGSGDTFNALVHSEKILRNVEFDLVVRDDHLNLVDTLVGNFQTKPRMVYAVPQSLHANVQAALYNQAPKWYRGPIIRRDPSGSRHLWADPGDWDCCNPISTVEIDSWVEYFKSIAPDKKLSPSSIIFFPEAISHPKKTFNVHAFAEFVFSTGVPPDRVFVNAYQLLDVSKYVDIGLTPLDIGHRDLLANIYTLGSRVLLIGTRSGVFDLARYSDAYAYIGMDLNWAKEVPSWRVMRLKHRLHLQEELLHSDENESTQLEKFSSFLSELLCTIEYQSESLACSAMCKLDCVSDLNDSYKYTLLIWLSLAVLATTPERCHPGLNQTVLV